MSAVEDILKKRIHASGPVTVAEYMEIALAHPEHGYYITRDPLGQGGDFTTAPEISQMFGELLGAWAAHCWMQHQPQNAPFALVELGPGRGTLMSDALRALSVARPFLDAMHLNLVETSPVLREKQAAALSGHNPQWHDRIETIPDGPALIIANEFFDALPVRQFVKTNDGWCERMVGLSPADKLSFGLAHLADEELALIPDDLRDAGPESLFEFCPAGLGIMTALAERIARDGIAMLMIDYGHDLRACGETLQAVHEHDFAPVLAAPGEADLTAHVDFAMLAEAAQAAGAKTYGPVGQGDFLNALGIRERAAMLKDQADTKQAADIDAAMARLTSKAQMGQMFRVMAVTHPDLPQPPGFDS